MESKKNVSKINYFVNEEKRTVVAMMNDCADDVLTDMKIDIFHPAAGSLIISNTFRGKAVCDKDDIWDIEKGKEIARSKMLAKYYRAKENVIRKYITQMNEYLEPFEKIFKTYSDRACKYEDDVWKELR